MYIFSTRKNRVCKKDPIIYAPNVKLHRALRRVGRTLSLGHSSSVSPPACLPGLWLGGALSRANHLGCSNLRSLLAARLLSGPLCLPCPAWRAGAAFRAEALGQGPASQSKSSILVLKPFHLRALAWRGRGSRKWGCVPFYI